MITDGEDEIERLRSDVVRLALELAEARRSDRRNSEIADAFRGWRGEEVVRARGNYEARLASQIVEIGQLRDLLRDAVVYIEADDAIGAPVIAERLRREGDL